MRFCPNCGSQVDDNAKFCTGCGEKLMQPAPAPQPQQPQYRQNVPQQPQQQYGQNVPPQAPVYGTPVNNYDYGQMQKPPKKKGKGLLIGAAAALGVCAVGGGGIPSLSEGSPGGSVHEADGREPGPARQRKVHLGYDPVGRCFLRQRTCGKHGHRYDQGFLRGTQSRCLRQ